MKDGELSEKDGRYELRFVRELSHPVEKVWEAVTSPAGPVGLVPVRRRGGAADRRCALVRVPRGRGRPVRGLDGRVHAAARRWSCVWEDDERLRLELAPAGGGGCVLTLINRFDEVGKAARDAAGWHACLDALEASLAGAVDRRRARLGRGPPGLRVALRPRGGDDRPADRVNTRRVMDSSASGRAIHHSRRAQESWWAGSAELPLPLPALSSSSAGSLLRTASSRASRPMMRTLERNEPSRPCCSTSPRPAPPPPR